MKNIIISIIIVNYRVKDELFKCIESIYKSRPRINFEVLVVDNDEDKTIENVLRNKFKEVVYIKSEKNVGFGAGNNLGAREARGEYLFFLNPDTKLLPETLDNLSRFIKNKKNVGAVSPLLLDGNNKPSYVQGSQFVTPLRAIVGLSIINKILPSNIISRKFFLKDWNRKDSFKADVVPGTAFLINKEIFEKIGGFDEKYFLFFEEADLAKKIKKLNLDNYIVPDARVVHLGGVSTRQRIDINKIYKNSQFYYFKKWYGLSWAIIINLVTSIGKYEITLFSILILALFLRTFRLNETMSFIGDQGWFYLSARDMLLTGQIPLVGIASSHPWLHQGAFWTYALSVGLWLSKFNPLAGAYVSISIDLLAILAIYNLGSVLNSKRLGVIAAALYATSPLIIQNARMPYHTSPIPLFTILSIYFLYKWIAGNKYFFPLLVLMLGVLYNLELATASFGIVVMTLLSYGLFRRQKWALCIFNRKILFLSFLAFMGSILPMLIYDLFHGFPQTLGFLAWIGYKLLVLLGYPPINPIAPVSIGVMFSFFERNYTQLIYPFNASLALLIFATSNTYLLIKLRKMERNVIVLVILNLLLIGGVFIAKTPSDAYLPMLFPGLILVIALFFNWGFESKKIRDIIIPLFFLIILFNCFYMGYKIYVKDNDSFTKRLNAVRYIAEKSRGKEYNLIGRGTGSQFESFTMNYKYLLWYFYDSVPSEKPANLKIYLEEKDGNILIRKND
ncbi:MAG: glycosyltransferase [Patescibacteria group bacterium]